MKNKIEDIKKRIKEAEGSNNNTLADVLLAVGTSNPALMEIARGTESAHIITKELSEILYLWDFKKDNLEAQKEKMVDFLHFLLCRSTESKTPSDETSDEYRPKK